MPMGYVLAAVLGLLFAPAARAEPFIPNDPFYGPNQWYSPTLGLPDAWGISRGSTAVTVAVLDTGIMTTTPDLAGRLLPPMSTTGTDPFTNETMASTTILRHGTWVASALAMGIDNGIGGAGIGDFSILPITVTNTNGNNLSQWIADGIRLAADQGARVINISHRTFTYGVLDDAAAYARSKGALTFISSGNSNARIDRTGLDNLIFVAGTDVNDARWSDTATGFGSSWGPFVDLAAPADAILVADPTLAPAGYGIADGTSFSAPIAAGIAALAWSINPHLTPDQVQAMLYNTAVDLGAPGWDEVFGHGRVNAAGVAAAALLTVPEPSSIVLLVVGAAGLILVARRRVRR